MSDWTRKRRVADYSSQLCKLITLCIPLLVDFKDFGNDERER